MDLTPPDLNPAKRSRPNSPELPDYAIDIMRHVDINERRLYCKRAEEIKNRWLEGMGKIASSYPKEVLHSRPKFDPSKPLPKGYAWTSYRPKSDHKAFAVKMHCIGCGLGLDHWPDDCPEKGTEEYERNFALLLEPNSDSDDDETETETKTKTESVTV
ncbi:uncharacterized protein LOC133717545 [Rosa rugosa]|uniref:uncharacterized protein LOC133717545 n=1 Tax=Rosa rugosa TaxID=74645 RepID=UPI002B411096|nr:uncharacterized protein LOC133717545 [Rosa rugosa]